MNPILITGIPRSGSTWMGNMIARSPEVGYIHEPFNVDLSPGIYGYRFPGFNRWFTYICNENQADYYTDVRKMIFYYYNPYQVIKTATSLKDVGRTVRDYALFLWYRFRKLRPLIKDPVALFSAEWLASVFDMDIVITIRHPAAFIGSLKYWDWRLPLGHMLEQPLLMKDYLQPFETEIREDLANKRRDVISHGALAWRIYHYVILEYQKKHANWLFVRHEDISRDPLNGYRMIFKKLNLKYTGKIQTHIREYTDTQNPKGAYDPFSYKVDSKSNIWNWKKRLNASEIQKIRESVRDISGAFYTDDDW